MYLHGFIDRSQVNGPGSRCVVYFQGCTLSCAGCWNPGTHEHGKGKVSSISELVDRICQAPGIEGVTFSGGEPMQQASSLVGTIEWIRARRRDLSIGMYSGYSLKELESGRFETTELPVFPYRDRADIWERIRSGLDFAVLGRYNQLQTTKELSLRGSENQDLILFSDRYKESDFQRQLIEITIKPNGNSTLTGFPIGVYKRIDEEL